VAIVIRRKTPEKRFFVMSKLLIHESPLTFQPSLAIAIGLNEAIVLQQVHYWLNNAKNRGYEYGGYKWVYNTYAEWRENNFPFWSENTIQRTFSNLEDAGLIVSIQPMKGKYDRTKYYRIDYTKLDAIDDTKLVSSLNESETTTETTHGADAPKRILNLSIENQIAAGVDEVTIPDNDNARRVDFSNLVAVGTSNPPAFAAIAMAFQAARNITLPADKAKGQRKAIKEMVEMGVKPEHVKQAVSQLMDKRMTVSDLFSVSKTAIDLANKPQEKIEYTRQLYEG
jgi:DNA-binding transcriptional regulator YhcF (GntR family)